MLFSRYPRSRKTSPTATDLSLQPDEIDVAVLALRELEVDRVVPYGQPAGEAEDHAARVAEVDDRARLPHQVAVPAHGGASAAPRSREAGKGMCGF